MEFGGCLNDDAFGPAAVGCRGNFDFTLKFESILFGLLPASIFVAVSVPRIVYLARRPSLVTGAAFQALKSAVLISYGAVELSLLVMSATKAARLQDFFISSSAVTFTAALCMIAVSFLEHSRSPRPSILLSSYLPLTLIFDVAECRTLWLAAKSADEISFTRLHTAAVALKALATFLESQHKTRWVQWDAKHHSPEETTGIYGLGAFVWLNKLFFAGYKKVLTLDDLFPLDHSMAAEALHERLASIRQAGPAGTGKKHALAKALIKTLAVPMLLPIAPRIAITGFTFCQPFLISSVLRYLQAPVAERDKNVGYGLIGAAILIYSGIAVATAFYWYFHMRVLYMARACLAGAVYKKTTEARAISGDSAAITLMSTDIERIMDGFIFLHEYWANIIDVSLASWLLYRELGAAVAAPLGVVSFSIITLIITMSLTANRQKIWMERIQRRVGMTAGIIANMKSVKIAGIATPIEKLIQGMRVDELKMGNRFRMVMVIAIVLSFAPLFISPVIAFAVTVSHLDAATIFSSLSYMVLLANPLIRVLQWAPETLAALTCVTRIQTYLESEPREDFRESATRATTEKESHADSGAVMTIKNGSFGWTAGTMSLRNIDLSIPASKLTIVIGPVGSGKSTLCRALLGETPVHQGQVVFMRNSRKIGYCDQSTFLSNGTIRDNIVGFSPFDRARYNEVIEATMLGIDLLTLAKGDKTNIGSNGITLSGGQRQRVALARALYLDTDFFIFDDVLSGLDADTEESVFRRVFGPEGLVRARNATAVLCTHSIRHLPSADHVVALGPEGMLVEQGSFQDLMENRKYVHSLGIEKRTSTSSSEATSAPDAADEATPPPFFRVRTTESVGSEHVEGLARANGSSSVYIHYFKSIGLPSLLAFLFTAVVSGFLYNWMTVWLNLWANDLSSAHPGHDNAWWLGLFGMFQSLAMIFVFVLVTLGMQNIVMLSGAKLHSAALATVINAPLRFFTTTDTGAVTNLFSQDMTLIDDELPGNLINFTVNIFMTTGMAAVVASSSPYLAISYPFLLVVLWGVQKFYLRTSRQLRLLDLEAKTPLYTHYIDTIKGVATFRAFGWVHDGILLNNLSLDNSQRPAYLLAMIQRWLGFTLDSVVCVLAVIVVALSTQVQSTTGFAGASLVTLMSFGNIVTNIIRNYTGLETSLGAIARLKSFSERTKPETLRGEDLFPPPSWPEAGEIEIKGVSASYSGLSEDESNDSSGKDSTGPSNLALRDLDITIRPGEKVAICGRSGSGKSSTILLLLRLLDPVPSSADNITIDGVPLSRVDRATLRQRIIAVPQDAVFLPDGSTYAANLDPFGAASPAECQAVLDAVGLAPLVAAAGGLDGAMQADALSQGQKQLFSLARALLRRRLRAREGWRSGVLLLDEVSSSVDMDTDRAMQAIIGREFEGYTVVMVSHRLEMVMDFDRVLVMSEGAVVETGAPRELVARGESIFKELWLVSNTGRQAKA